MFWTKVGTKRYRFSFFYEEKKHVKEKTKKEQKQKQRYMGSCYYREIAGTCYGMDSRCFTCNKYFCELHDIHEHIMYKAKCRQRYCMSVNINEYGYCEAHANPLSVPRYL